MGKVSDQSEPALRLYLGQTTHKRFVPFERHFAYKLFLIDIDIDRLDEASKTTSLFKVDKPGLFSFRRRDHGCRADTALRPWAEDRFAEAGIDLDGGAIRLVTFPRHLGYKFAPISLWFGFRPDGHLEGVIYEVNNTFGDTHAYVAGTAEARAQHTADKQLYVSPFFDVSGAYHFTLREPGEKLDLIVENLNDKTRIHMANIKARRAEATGTAFARAAIARPLSTLGVTLAIHWEALHLWLKGAGYRSRPKPADTASSVARSAKHLTPTES